MSMSGNATLHPLDTRTSPAGDAPPTDASVDQQELAAVQAMLAGKLVPRLELGLRALYNILRDPTETRHVFTLFLVTNARHIPGFIAHFSDDPEGARLLEDRSAIDSRSVDFDALGRLPEDTLGGAFARHMARNGLSPDIFHAPPGLPDPFAYIGQRVRQTHDIWHVVAGYDTTIDDELALLAFYHAQSKMPGPALLAVAGAIRFFPKHPGVFRKVLNGYRRGKAARRLVTVRWEEMWELPLSEVRARYRVLPSA
jgi:ubiquinone biosynthesis protein COQ4